MEAMDRLVRWFTSWYGVRPVYTMCQIDQNIFYGAWAIILRPTFHNWELHGI